MQIKNWSKFQHFKDRRPPWIKLHREMLDQRDINQISDCAFRVLVGLWLIASEDEAKEGNLPPIEDIEFKLRIEKAKLIKAINELDSFLIHDDITAISEEYPHDEPEERKVETETDNSPNPTGLESASDDDRPPVNGCPYKKLEVWYTKHCPRQTKIIATSWTPSRKAVVRNAWSNNQDEEWWESFFEYCGTVKFLNGENDRGWKASMFWIMKPENLAKVTEKAYK